MAVDVLDVTVQTVGEVPSEFIKVREICKTIARDSLLMLLVETRE